MSLAEVFQESARNPGGRRYAPSDLERRLREILDACRLVWPELDVPEHVFVRNLAENLPEDGELDSCLRRNKDEQIGNPHDNDGLKRIPVSSDAELNYLKNRYQVEFKQAVEDAIATLGTEQLRVLRLHYHDGLSIDRIGALLSAHRTTAARWIRAASEVVRDETRRLLHARLGLSTAEFDSLAGLVQSQLHLSLGRLLPSP